MQRTEHLPPLTVAARDALNLLDGLQRGHWSPIEADRVREALRRALVGAQWPQIQILTTTEVRNVRS